MTDTVESIMALADAYASHASLDCVYSGGFEKWHAKLEEKQNALRAAVEQVVREKQQLAHDWAIDHKAAEERAERAERNLTDKYAECGKLRAERDALKELLREARGELFAYIEAAEVEWGPQDDERAMLARIDAAISATHPSADSPR